VHSMDSVEHTQLGGLHDMGPGGSWGYVA
jgi:hypothetical protein